MLFSVANWGELVKPTLLSSSLQGDKIQVNFKFSEKEIILITETSVEEHAGESSDLAFGNKR